MSAAGDARERVLAAAVTCAGRVGLARLTVDEVAREAGVGRATVYRWFPGGREQVIDEAITFEVARFLGRLERAVAGAEGLRDRLVAGLLFAHRALEEHEVLQHVLATEPGGLLPHLQQTMPLVLGVLRDAIRPMVEAEPRLRPGIDPGEAAEWLARMFLSFVGDPGRWDLRDPDEVARLVDGELLAGVVTPVT